MSLPHFISLVETVLPLSATGMPEAAVSTSSLHILTTGLARGDDEAWTRFHRDFGPVIFRQLLAATRGDYALASEALQQTYLRVARHAKPCDCAPMFDGWLRVVSRSALNDCRRRRQSYWALLTRRHADPSDALTEAEEEPVMLAALDASIAQLSAEDRALLHAKYYAGTTVRTLAFTLAVSEKGVESRLTRARAALRQRLLSAFARHD